MKKLFLKIDSTLTSTALIASIFAANRKWINIESFEIESNSYRSYFSKSTTVS